MKEKEKVYTSLLDAEKNVGNSFFVCSFEWWQSWIAYIKHEDVKLRVNGGGRSSEASISWGTFHDLISEKVYILHNIHKA